MEIHYDVPEFLEETSVAIGNFDGVHVGHNSVLKKAQDIAKSNNHKFVVLTFLDHPTLITKSKSVPQLLSTSQEKIAKLEKFGVDICIILKFDKEFSKISPEGFVKKILVEKLKAKNVAVGFNFFFGHKAEGNSETLKKLAKENNFIANIVEQVFLDSNVISSSEIRKLIKKGQVSLASKMLGENYLLGGLVVKGKGIGRAVLGIPTANVSVDSRKLLPVKGVYACKANVRNKKYSGVVNIGNRPTFDNGLQSIEVHIFDFDENIYGENIAVEFISFIRGEVKFNSPEELTKQIHQDIEKVKELV